MYLDVAPYTELLSEITTALEANASIIKLTGPGGSGKSAFCNMLVRTLRQLGQEVIYFLHPPQSMQELLDAARQQLHLPGTAEFNEELAAWYSARPNPHQRLILLIDDTHAMDSGLLAAVAQLAAPHINLVIVGADGLDQLLLQPQLHSLTTRISRKFQLRPLTLAQLRVFCRKLLHDRHAGMLPPTDEQLRKLLQKTGGLPGAVIQQVQADATKSSNESGSDRPLDLVLPVTQRPVRRSRRHIRLHVILSFSVIAIAGLSLLVTRDPLTEPPTSAEATAVGAAVFEAADTVAVTAVMPAADTALPAATASLPGEPTAAVEPVANTGQAAPNPTTTAELPATAPAPVTAQRPVDEVVPAPATVTQADIEALLTQWTSAWQQQQLPTYFAAYASDFVPANGTARERWQADRTRIIGNARDIRISWSELDWRVLDADSISVELALDYQAAGYRDVTRKRLRLRREADGLRIAEEQNLAVERR